MRHRIFLVILLITIIFFGIAEVKALEVVDLNPTIQVGETKDIEIYVNAPDSTKQINFSLIFLSYDVVGTFEPLVGVLTNNGTTHSISFNESITGRVKLGTIKIKISKNILANTGTINLHNANATLEDGTTTKLNNQSIQVNIPKENVEEVKTNLLKEIKSNIVNIALVPNKYEYDVSVNNEVDKLDLTATAIDETYKIDISDQFIKEGKNQIFITVSKGTISEKYTINITKDEKKEVLKEETDKNKDKIKKDKVSKTENKNFKSGWTVVIIGLIIGFIVGLSMLKKK